MSEIYSYKVFAAVVDKGSFTSAAADLEITPSAVSHTISKLEKEIGFALFVREKGRLSLTKNGEELLPRMIDIINLEDKINQEKQEILGVTSGRVKVGAFNSVTIKWLPHIIKSFKMKYPGIEVEVMQGKYSDVVSGVRNGMLDIGFVTTTQELNSEITALYDDPLMCVTSVDFVPQNDGYVTVDEIGKMKLIMQAEGLASDTEAFLEKHDIHTYSNLRVADDSALIAMVASGFGVSIMPKLLFDDEEKSVKLFPIEPAEFRTIGIVTLPEKFLSPAACRMIDEIKMFVSDNYRSR